MRFVLRGVRAEIPLLLVTVGVLALTGGTAAAAARIVGQMTAAGLRAAVTDATPAARGLTATRQLTDGRVTTAAVQEHGARLQDELDPPLREIVSGVLPTVDVPRFDVADPVIEGRVRVVSVRVRPGYADHAEIVAGRLPRPTDERVTVPRSLRHAALGTDQPSAVLVEVAVTQATADALRVGVGDTLTLRPGDDPYVVRAVARRPFLAVRIVGLVALDAPSEPQWFGDGSAHVPTQISAPGGTSVTVYATVLASGAALPDLADSIRPIPVVASWHYAVDPDRVDPADVGALRPALRRLAQRYVTSPFVPEDRTGVRTNLGAVLDAFVAAREATLRAIAVAGSGLAGVLCTVVALLAGLRARSRRPLRVLLRVRGASAGQLLTAGTAELTLLAVAGVAIGLAVARSVGRPVPHAVWLAGLAAAAVAVALLAADQVDHAWASEPSARPRRSARRVTAEVTVACLAVAGAVVARRRGILAAGADPLLLAVPGLIALTAGLGLVRLLPVGAGALADGGVGRRWTAVSIGLRRVARQPAATTLPVLAVILAVATAVLADAHAGAVAAELDRRAWQTVGAPARLDAAPGRSLPSRGPGAAAYRTRIVAPGGGGITLLAVQRHAYRELTAGTPAATDLSPLGDSTAGPLAAITSPGAIGPVGTTAELSLPGVAVVPIEVHATRDRFPSLSDEEPFAVVDYDALADVVPTALEPNRRYLASGAGVAGARTQDGAVTALAADPLAATGLSVFRGAVLLAGALAVVAVGISLVLAARTRQRDLAYLRTLGLSGRQATAMLATEVLPPLLAAIVAGVALGAGIVVLLGSGMRLGALAGDAAVAPRVDLFAAGLQASLLAVAIVAATLVAARRGRGVDLTQALRMEER